MNDNKNYKMMTAAEIFDQFDKALILIGNLFNNAHEQCKLLDLHEEKISEETRANVE